MPTLCRYYDHDNDDGLNYMRLASSQRRTGPRNHWRAAATPGALEDRQCSAPFRLQTVLLSWHFVRIADHSAIPDSAEQS